VARNPKMSPNTPMSRSRSISNGLARCRLEVAVLFTRVPPCAEATLPQVRHVGPVRRRSAPLWYTAALPRRRRRPYLIVRYFNLACRGGTLQDLIIRGARAHNLKNVDLELPRNKFIVFTGVSGSGKSTLAFDTVYAEGQRRYVESLSAYARQFLGIMDKPDVDSIEGLSPAISIDQKTTSHNPRSTVGTVT